MLWNDVKNMKIRSKSPICITINVKKWFLKRIQYITCCHIEQLGLLGDLFSREWISFILPVGDSVSLLYKYNFKFSGSLWKYWSRFNVSSKRVRSNFIQKDMIATSIASVSRLIRRFTCTHKVTINSSSVICDISCENVKLFQVSLSENVFTRCGSCPTCILSISCQWTASDWNYASFNTHAQKPKFVRPRVVHFICIISL